MKKNIYLFGPGMGEGNAGMKELLGGKGANLAEMSNLGIPVPPGFTITTEVCTYYVQHRKYPSDLGNEVEQALKRVEKAMGAKFGDPESPLLLSVRSGARASMPGMMETILNVGITEETIPGLIKKSGNERFVYDAYRRLIMMYSDVVLEKAQGIDPEEHGIRKQFEREIEETKKRKGLKDDTELSTEDLRQLCQTFKAKLKEVLKVDFPGDPTEQLWESIRAVFKSWMGKRAISYRNIEDIPDDWGTAVNVQAMVFGNMGENSATGVAFTRDPATGDKIFYGEFLPNAQGEDVVAGIRTPQPLNEATKAVLANELSSMEETMPQIYEELNSLQKKLETHYRDMQDIEFTVQEGKLFILQTRTGKRGGAAAIKIAVDMCEEGLISQKEALLQVKPEQISDLLHPMVSPKAERTATKLADGLPAGPGGAVGQIVFTADDAETQSKEGKKVILVRAETSPEDVHGMHVAEGVLTSTGGITSHAALVARGWGKCCIVGCSALNIDVSTRTVKVGGKILKEGDWITLNGTKGTVYAETLPLFPADPEKNLSYKKLMIWADEIRGLKVRANADTSEDAKLSRKFGAVGIGLCRTEHMFFGPERIKLVREMILADNKEMRQKALGKLLPYQKEDFIMIFRAMNGMPVTIRTLDPPLHEFLPHNKSAQAEMAKQMRISPEALREKVELLSEVNPMLGHRGCRLGITYPEITEMQVQAIMEAACELTKKGIKVLPEIMIPLVGTKEELHNQREIVVRIAEVTKKKYGVDVNYLIGTMIEIPRAAVVADEIAEFADFFSFGTNDLTQLTFGYSRDDVVKFLPDYLENKILANDPFQTIDRKGVGELMKIGIQRGRLKKPNLKIGICGEHGGDPKSIAFCHQIGIDYVSCSTYRIPIARLTAAQANINSQ
ncbi:MAG: Pyruvate, phosphate dikinase [Syntrophomonadaceae bacterium]|nr:Pyruvate, phosphate dikinase [Bacillota bacterium]